jgi:hypothetical protein
MRDWLDWHDSGESVISIAKKAHRDTRTVKRGIEQARRERDARGVRSELLKSALRNHQDNLLEMLKGVLSVLEVPASGLDIGGERGENLAPLNLSGSIASYIADKGWTVKLNVEDESHWELLQEHTKRDPMWAALHSWKEALAAHVEARLALKRKAVTLLEKKTGLKLNRGAAFHLEPFAVVLLYQGVLDQALGIRDWTEPEKDIAALISGEVSCRNSPLAGVAEGAEQKCKKNILDALQELKISAEARNVAITQKEAHEAAVKARRTVEEISLLGLVPGECRVCRRLGL